MHKSIQNDNFKNILVWASMGIGNTVNFIPFLINLRRRFPNAKITLLCSAKKNNYDLLHNSNYYDNLIYFNKHSRTSKYFSLLRVLLGNYDLFLVKWHRNPLVARFIRCAFNAKIIGHISGGGWESDYDYMVDEGVPMEKNIHDVNQYLNLLKPLGVKNPSLKQKIVLSNKTKEKTRNIIKNLNLDNKDFMIGLHLDAGSAQPYKNIDSKVWIDLLKNLEEKYRNGLFFLLGSDQSEIGNNTLNEFQKSKAFINLMGKLSIHETASLISSLDILIGVDSSLKTIADAVGTESIVISGATNYLRSHPIETPHHITRLDLSCSPCDIFGPTKWDSCDHRSCIYKLNSSFIIKDVNNYLNQRNLIRTKEINSA